MARNLLLGTILQSGLTFLTWLVPAAHSQPAPNARPTGGTVVAGSATISRTSGTNTQINQFTQRATIDWRSFDVGSQQSVTFSQPPASAVALNRVIGPDPSQIAGRIDANGQVILVNQSGVNFYKGAQVNTAGLIVTTANITNQNFMAGNMKFDQPGKPNAKIDNQGNITIRQAGLAAFVAPQVANSGTITAKLGHVLLAGAKTATLDLYGDGLLSLDVTNQVAQAPVGPDGKAVTALVTNTGVIIADGGTVQLTARAADGIVQNLVQAGGTIRAATVGDQTGTVALNGMGGSIVVEGQLAAPGRAPGTKGGAIEVVSDRNVTVGSTARINASGKAGGGAVAVGTTLARARGGLGVTSALTAKDVTVAQGAKIAANAITEGNGGRLTVLSEGTTRMDGLLSVRGGDQSGDGGLAEVSGGMVAFTGHVDAKAPHGTAGTLLLDPLDLYVSDKQPDGTFEITSGSTITAGGSPDANRTSWISPTVLEGQDANISLAASRDLLVATSLGTANTLNLGSFALTLTAARNLTIDRGFTIIAGNSEEGISLTATSGNITLSGSSGVSAGLITSAQLGELPATTVRAGGFTTLAMTAGQSISLGDAVLTGNGTTAALDIVDLSAGAGITQSAKGIINANTLTSSAGVTGDVSLVGTANTLITVNTFAVSDGNFILVNSGDLTLLNKISGNNLFFEVNRSGGVLTLGGPPVSTNGIPATLIGKSGRISLVADTIQVADISGNTITAGTVELAPFSAINTSLLGSAGQVIDSTLLSIIQTNGGTLEIGGFTNAPAGAVAPTPRASSISIDGAVNLAGTAGTLRLDTTGTITESATSGSLNVTNLAGTAASATIDNPNNLVSNLGNFTTSGDFTLVTAESLTVDGTVNAVNPTDAATITLHTFGGLQIGAATEGILNAGTVTLIASGGSITEPNGAIRTNSLAASASNEGEADVLLTSTSNAIEASTGITANSGNIALVDDPPLLLTGNYSGNNLFFEVTVPGGGLVLGNTTTPATLSGGVGGLISLVADNVTVGNVNSSIIVSFGTVELAPFSPIHESVGGTSSAGQLLIGSALLSIINNGKQGPLDTLVIGGFTDQPAKATAPAAAASGVTIDGPLNLSAQAFTLNLLSNGSVTEPGGPITVPSVTGSSVGTFSLANPSNAIETSFGIAAANGDVILVDQSDLLLVGPHTGNNLFFEVARKGGTLHLGSEGPVQLTAGTGDRISLVADAITQSGADNLISVPMGTLELAPFSQINTSANGTIASGQLLIGSGLLSIVSPAINTLVIGGFTNVPVGATTSSPSAASVTIDGTVDLAPLASALDLEAVGPVTQSAPILNVGTLLGMTGSTTLTNPANTVAILGNYTATSGLALTDAASLLIAGSAATTGNAMLTITGALGETGSLTAAQLTGSTTGPANLAGTNRIASIGDFSAAGFAMNDSVDLLLAGTLNAVNIAIHNPANQITLGDGATIVTGGTVRPSGALQPTLEPTNGGAGALLQSAGFTQVGSSKVLGQGGGPATVQVSTTGNIQFDPQLGLQATGTWLILDLTSGTANGNTFINALDVSYTTPGSTDLLGTIAGVTGGPAAAIGNIQPAINTNYLFNNCVIASPVCQPSPTPTPTPVPQPTPAPTPTPVVRLPENAITSALGGIFQAFAPPLPTLASLPTVTVMALPMLQPQPQQLTDPDVVPPNITFLDY